MKTCERCGTCCKRFVLKNPEMVFPDFIKEFVKVTRPDIIKVVSDHEIQVMIPCKHYSEVSKSCRIYDTRPKLCKNHFCGKCKSKD